MCGKTELFHMLDIVNNASMNMAYREFYSSIIKWYHIIWICTYTCSYIYLCSKNLFMMMIILKATVMGQGKTEGKWSSIHPLAHSLYGHNSQGWPRARNFIFVSHMVAGVQVLGPSVDFLRPLTVNYIESGAARIWTGSCMGCQHHS